MATRTETERLGLVVAGRAFCLAEGKAPESECKALDTAQVILILWSFLEVPLSSIS